MAIFKETFILEFIAYQTDTPFHFCVTNDIKAWTLHESWHKAWASIHECAMQLLWSSPVKHYECVNRRVQMLCLISVFFWIQAWNVLQFKLREDGICRKNKLGLDMVRLFIFSRHFTLMIWSLSNALLCNRLVKKGHKVVQKKNQLIMFCDKVYILFSNWPSRNLKEISCLFVLFFGWWFMFSFYLKAEKCLKKKKKT